MKKPAKGDKGKAALVRLDPLNLVFLPAIVICISLILGFATQPWTQFWYKRASTSGVKAAQV